MDFLFTAQENKGKNHGKRVMKTLIIDGYNAIHKIREIEKILMKNLETSRDVFCRYLLNWKHITRYQGKICVVFDGQGEMMADLSSPAPGIEFVFSRRDSDADSYIVRYTNLGTGANGVLTVNLYFQTSLHTGSVAIGPPPAVGCAEEVGIYQRNYPAPLPSAAGLSFS